MLRRFAFNLQHLAKQVVGGTNAGRTITHRLGFGGRHVLLQRLEGRLPTHQQNHGRFDQHAEVGEIIRAVPLVNRRSFSVRMKFHLRKFFTHSRCTFFIFVGFTGPRW